jgi:hypothetical protein
VRGSKSKVGLPLRWKSHRRDRPQRRVASSEKSPREKYEEFARENERWHRRVEEAIDELDELARELGGDAAREREEQQAS